MPRPHNFTDELSELHDQMDRIMDGLFGKPAAATIPRRIVAWRPCLDVVETQDAYLISAEVPGVRADSIEVTLDGNFLTIRGVRERNPVPDTASWRIMEINYGAFERVLRLPQAVEADSVKAELRDGFLTVSLKKAAAKRQSFRVSVQ